MGQQSVVIDHFFKVRNEKERQLALLKLKREQMRLKKDDQMNAASLVFTKAHAKDSKLVFVPFFQAH